MIVSHSEDDVISKFLCTKAGEEKLCLGEEEKEILLRMRPITLTEVRTNTLYE